MGVGKRSGQPINLIDELLDWIDVVRRPRLDAFRPPRPAIQPAETSDFGAPGHFDRIATTT
jgi:hypothetical protein